MNKLHILSDTEVEEDQATAARLDYPTRGQWPSRVNNKTREEATILFNNHKVLAYLLAKNFYRCCYNDMLFPDDVAQITRLCLWKLALSFDQTKGCKFSTYLTSFLKPQISNELRIYTKRRITCENISVEEIMHPSDEPSVYFRYLEIEEYMLIFDSIHCRKREIVKKRFVEERTLKDIGHDYGITRERVRQIESAAIKDSLTLLAEMGVVSEDLP